MLVPYLLLPFLCVLGIPPRAGPAPWGIRVALGVAVYEALLLCMGLVLGLAGWLHPGAYRAAILVTTAAAAAAAWRNAPRRIENPLRGWAGTRRGRAILGVALVLGVTVAVQLGWDGLHGTGQWDGLWYHVPRMWMWSRHGSFEPWPTPTWQQLGLPVGGDVVLGSKVLLGMGWAGMAWVTAALLVGASACVYTAARDLRLDRWRALVATLLFVSFPVVGGRIGAVNTDLAAAVPVMAGYVALRPGRASRPGFAAYVLLTAAGLACKPTVVPLAVVLGAWVLWRERRSLRSASTIAVVAASSAAGAAVIVGSVWPVWSAFGDPAGGAYGRMHIPVGWLGALRAVLGAGLHWILEPLGYLPRGTRVWLPGLVEHVYRPLGILQVPLHTDPAAWVPQAGPDNGRTGVATVLAVPWLVRCLSARSRWTAAALAGAAFLAVSGSVYAQPWAGRFTIVLLGGLAILWASPRVFTHGKGAAVLVAVVALNSLALLAETVYVTAVVARETTGAGRYAYLEPQQRGELARALGGGTLQALSCGACDVLLPGPALPFTVDYLTCPADDDWRSALARAGSSSRWLAVVHAGRQRFRPGPGWARPGVTACPEVDRAELEDALRTGGWRRWARGAQADVWELGAVESSP